MWRIFALFFIVTINAASIPRTLPIVKPYITIKSPNPGSNLPKKNNKKEMATYLKDTFQLYYKFY